MNKSCKAFSLVELVIGIGILAIGVVSLAIIFSAAFTSAQKGVEYSAGAAVAEMVLEDYLYQHPVLAVESNPPYLVTKLNRAEYHHAIEVAALTPDLMEVKVKVWWYDPRKPEGITRLEMKRLVYNNK